MVEATILDDDEDDEEDDTFEEEGIAEDDDNVPDEVGIFDTAFMVIVMKYTERYIMIGLIWC